MKRDKTIFPFFDFTKAFECWILRNTCLNKCVIFPISLSSMTLLIFFFWLHFPILCLLTPLSLPSKAFFDFL